MSTQDTFVATNKAAYEARFREAYGDGVVPTMQPQDVEAILHHNEVEKPPKTLVSVRSPYDGRKEAYLPTHIVITNSGDADGAYIGFVRAVAALFKPRQGS